MTLTRLLLAACSLALAVPPAAAQTVTLDRSTTFQTIDGFGFFGGMDVWWSSGPFHDAAWISTVIDDLGLTIHRNEYYSEEPNQDADWAKQKSLIQALLAQAKASKEPLKLIWTVWTPPSSMKSNSSLKNGGTLLSSSYSAFGSWLVQGIDNYADLGAELYALSPQNEPLFSEPYNSCVYTAEQYRDMLKVVGPIVKAAYPKVKIFGPEHMLFGVGKDYDWNNLDPTKKVLDDANAAQYLDIFACHGYGADGATPTPGSTEAQYWAKAEQRVGALKPIWMSETSGYPNTDDGALDYALSIHAALAYGHAAAWVHWQGSDNFVGADGVKSKKYFAAKQFYRFVRPGAKMIDASSSDSELFVTAFDHAAYGVFTVVLINTASAAKSVSLSGSQLPPQLTRHRTSSSEGCVEIDTVASSSSVDLPARSITTLVSGDVYGRLGSTPASDAGASDATTADGATGDGATGADAGLHDDASATDASATGLRGEDGCSCAVGHARRDATWPWLLLGLGLLLRIRSRVKGPAPSTVTLPNV